MNKFVRIAIVAFAVLSLIKSFDTSANEVVDVDALAATAAKAIDEIPVSTKYEHISLLLSNGHFTRPYTDKSGDHVRVPTLTNPGDIRVIGMVHNHPKGAKPGRLIEKEGFSDADIIEARRLGVPSYVLTHNGQLMRWTSGDEGNKGTLVTTIR